MQITSATNIGLNKKNYKRRLKTKSHHEMEYLSDNGQKKKAIPIKELGDKGF